MAQGMRGRRPLRLIDPRELTLDDALSIALPHLAQHRDLSGQTVNKVAQVCTGFVRRARRLGGETLADVDAGLVAEFVKARNSDGSRPSVATMHLRRWTVRLVYRTLRHAGVQVDDPTADLELPPRSSAALRPLTDEEVLLCRVLAVYPATATLKPAAWGLAEATASTSEIPAVRRDDVHPRRGVVWIAGSRHTEARWADLTEWATTQLRRRMRDLPPDGEALVAYTAGGSAESRQAASCLVIHKVLRRAGLGQEADVRPASVRAWAGFRVYRQTGRIEEVARRLGLRSLDSAARLIGLDWREGD